MSLITIVSRQKEVNETYVEGGSATANRELDAIRGSYSIHQTGFPPVLREDILGFVPTTRCTPGVFVLKMVRFNLSLDANNERRTPLSRLQYQGKAKVFPGSS